MRDRAVASAVRRAPVDRHPQPAGVSSISGYLIFCARFSVLSVVIIVWFLVIGKYDQLKLPELRKELGRRGAKLSGRKKELIERQVQQ